MKVKIDNIIYDSEETAIMVILTENDKYNIRHMLTSCTKYACFPASDTRNEVEKRFWMNNE